MEKGTRMKNSNGKQVTLFKVCHVHNGMYLSSQHGTLPKGLVKEYKKGETTVPDVGYLFAFKTIEDAKTAFRDESGVYATFRCKGVIVKELKNGDNIDIIGPDTVYGKAKRSYKRVLKSWWGWFLNPNGVPSLVRPYLINLWGCPPNTVLCSELTPISRVR